MDKEALISYLLRQMETSDSVSGEYVIIGKKEAVEIVRQLAGGMEIRRPATGTEGKTLFYCADCEKSFWAVAREDPECFQKWHYHTWYADCPLCRREVSQNDRYWR